MLPGWITVTIVLAIFLLGVVVGAGADRVARRALPGRNGYIQILCATPGRMGVPTVAYTVLPIAFGIFATFRSKAFRKVVDAAPLTSLIGVQLYRVFGASFLLQYFMGTMPAAFAWPAGVGDLLIGLTALPVAWLCREGSSSGRGVAVVWSLLGMGDFVMAPTLGFLTTPGPFQALAFESPSLTRTVFPGVLVPTPSRYRSGSCSTISRFSSYTNGKAVKRGWPG
jgi:hypothetical protein